MKISVFGNEDMKNDSMPVELIPDLQKKFPEHEFIHQDPNEDVLPPNDKEWVVIDTVEGINEVKLFDNIKDIKSPRRVSLHDYDLAMHLQLIKKIYPNLAIRIIGVPQVEKKQIVKHGLVKILTDLLY